MASNYMAVFIIIIIFVVHSNSQTNTSNTTTYPTHSPVVCTYLPFDGNDYVNVSNKELNVTNLINYVKLKNNATLIQADQTAIFLQGTLKCNNSNGCSLECTETASCYQSNMTCNSNTGCNIKCENGFSCGQMRIFAQRDINSTQSLNTAVNIVCKKDSCQQVKVYIRDIASVHIHCVEEDSCTDMTVLIEDMSSKNNNNTSINCYSAYACTNLNVITDGLLTQLNMYEYSPGVVLNNKFGYIPQYNTITCNINDYYVEFIFDKNKNIKHEARNQYAAQKLPCENVTIQCMDINGLDATCFMQYTFLLDTPKIEKLQENGSNYTCVNFVLKDIVELSCVGTCISSPTRPPTSSPSISPSHPPTLSPSLSPIASPTIAPSLFPSLNPSISPSKAPITPTLNPTTAPTITPTFTPTSAPTYNPTQAPTRFPTIEEIEYEYKLEIIYVFWNLTVENYDFILNYFHNSAIQHMEEIIELNYWDRNLLSEYKLFALQIKKINEIDLNHKGKLTKDMLYGRQMMFTQAVILMHTEHQNYFVRSSQYLGFENSTTYSFREYFKNPILKFTVANASNLRTESIYKSENKLDITWIIIITIFSCAIICFCIYWGHKMYIEKIRIPNNRKQRSIQNHTQEFVKIKNTLTNENNDEGENENNDDDNQGENSNDSFDANHVEM
eukprot:266992_1